MASGPEGRREESVQFSLKELLKLEDERLAEQSRERKAREAAAAEESARAERQRREEAAARERESAAALEHARKTELDELARREAMQKAIVEQARLSVDVRARAEERELERRHELELAKLRAVGGRSSVGSIAGSALFGGVVMLIVCCGVHFGVTKPAVDRRIAQLELDVAAADERTQEASRRTDEQRRAADDLRGKLRAAEEELDGLKKVKASPSSSGGVVRPPVPAAAPAPRPPPKPVTCLEGDPMCPVIVRH